MINHPQVRFHSSSYRGVLLNPELLFKIIHVFLMSIGIKLLHESLLP